MARQPEKYVQKDRIWNPIEEKWEPRNRYRYTGTELSQDEESLGERLKHWGDQARETAGGLFDREETTSGQYSGNTKQHYERQGSFSGKMASSSRRWPVKTHSSGSGGGKTFLSVIIGIFFLIVFGNILINLLSLIMFGIF